MIFQRATTLFTPSSSSGWINNWKTQAYSHWYHLSRLLSLIGAQHPEGYDIHVALPFLTIKEQKLTGNMLPKAIVGAPSAN